MKFVISLFLTFPVLASPIRIYHEEGTDNAPLIRDIFLQEYSIPEDLIALKQVAVCEELKVQGKLDLCLKNNGDLIVVSVDKGFVHESLRIFQAP